VIPEAAVVDAMQHADSGCFEGPALVRLLMLFLHKMPIVPGYAPKALYQPSRYFST
jgi:hypothetical protein